MSVVYIYIKATSTQAGGVVLVEASPEAVRALAELGEPAAIALKTAIDTAANAQSAVDYLKSAIGSDLAGTIKTIGSIATDVAVGEAVALTVAAGVGAFISLPYALLVGAIAGVAYGVYGPKIYDDGWEAAYNLGQAISPTVNTATTAALNWVAPRRDPLVLDLDGGGISTSGINPNAPILFDQDGDGTLTATGWIAVGEAIVVRDLNGNALIDSGRELFGDETILANGQKAANGFAALAELDTGSLVNGVVVGAGDGKFDAKDAQYANLRVWRDLNQDGISQTGELQTLTQTGVQSISLSSTASSTSYANGNATLVQTGSFTRSDGSAGQAGSFILAQDNFTTSFTPIAISAAASTMANIGGCGWVRGLQEAATLSPKLVALQQNTRKRELQSKSDGSCKLAATRWSRSQVSPKIRQSIKLLIKEPHHILRCPYDQIKRLHNAF